MSQGYELFNEIEDKDLRSYNRAQVMFNMLQNQGMTRAGLRDSMVYLQDIPQSERRDVVKVLSELLEVPFES